MQQCHREIGARVRWENWQEGSHYSRNLKHEICQPIDLIAAAKGCWLDLSYCIATVYPIAQHDASSLPGLRRRNTACIEHFLDASMRLRWSLASWNRKPFPIREMPFRLAPIRSIFHLTKV